MNADTKVHLAHIQAFLYKLESLAGENIILLYLFGKKIIIIIIIIHCSHHLSSHWLKAYS